MPKLGKSQLLNPEGLSKIDPDGYCTYVITWELTKKFCACATPTIKYSKHPDL